MPTYLGISDLHPSLRNMINYARNHFLYPTCFIVLFVVHFIRRSKMHLPYLSPTEKDVFPTDFPHIAQHADGYGYKQPTRKVSLGILPTLHTMLSPAKS